MNGTVDSSKKCFHILALSGGGYRGLYTATVLKELEADFGGEPLARKFDLICGTSVGGLLAMGLAAEVPAQRLQEMFERDGRRIFGSSMWFARIARWLRKWFWASHSPKGLSAVLDDVFGNKTIGELRHRLLVPAVNCSTGKGQFFKTPHTADFVRDHKIRLSDVGLATAAAPTYFPLHRIGEMGPFADGGLVANAPGLLGLHEARHILKLSDDTVIRVLAVGTMSAEATLRGGAWLGRGVLGWGSSIFDLVISAQEFASNAMLTHAIGDHFCLVDDPATPSQSRDVASLDLASPAATNVLKSRGNHAAQRMHSKPQIAAFRNHTPTPPTFYHGPNKNNHKL